MKRLIDISVACAALLLLWPVMIVSAFVIWVSMGRPIFFRQVRPGLDCKPFTIYKFRTMTTVTDQRGELLPDSQRMTSFGIVLRKFSIDELPQLINVIKGDLSLVGPRPLLMEYIPLYSKEQMRRHKVRPGITGWAQVHGRNALTWQKRFEHDVWYVDHQSVLLDVKIMALTIMHLFKREGISEPGQATMTKFTGDKDQ